MTQIRQALRQSGISPKVLNSFIVGLITYALTKLAIPWNPIVEQGVTIAAMTVTGWLSPPGDVVVKHAGERAA